MSKDKDISTMFTKEENKKKWKTRIWTGYQREERCYQSCEVWSILAEKRQEKMSKSVLVINTPKYCALCVLRSGVHHPFCRVDNRDITDLSIRPDWCPLKPLPEKFDNEKDRKLGDFEPLFKIGWNACIGEITKEVK